VDSILDKESYTLEELLDEDELIQECKSLNARLTAYLKQKETVEKLVSVAIVLTGSQHWPAWPAARAGAVLCPHSASAAWQGARLLWPTLCSPQSCRQKKCWSDP